MSIKINKFNIIIFCTLLSIFSIIQCQKSNEINSKNINPKIKEITNKYLGIIKDKMKYNIPSSVSIALVNKHGVVWKSALGHTNYDQEQRINPKTTFSIQSTSKTFTALGVMMAVQKGLVSLDTPITTYLPDFTVHSRFEEYPENKITLRHLLSHRAGLTHDAPVGNNFYTDFPSFEAHIKSISDTWLRYPVGQRFAYSNLGIDLAGYILQIVSGKPFAQFMKENVLTPLGLKKSSFDWYVIEKNKNRAIGNNSKFIQVPLKFGLIPAGGMYSNIEDMSKFVQFLLNKGMIGDKVIIEERYLNEMFTIQFPYEKQRIGYGLGIYIECVGPKFDIKSYNHGGDGFGFHCHMSWYPDFDIGVVLLTNSMDHNLMSLPSKMIKEIVGSNKFDWNGKQLYKFPDPINVNQDFQKKIIGNYLHRNVEMNIVLKNDKLVAGVKDKQFTFFFTSQNEGYTVDDDNLKIPFRFVRNKNDEPLYLIYLFHGICLDFNGNENDKPGIYKKKWDKYLGKYSFKQYNQKSFNIIVNKKNEYLYLDNQKLLEHKPGLFFTLAGEALDLRKENSMSWRNIKITKNK